MKRTLTVACISLKSAWKAVFLRSAFTALLLAPLAALHAAKPNSIILLGETVAANVESVLNPKQP